MLSAIPAVVPVIPSAVKMSSSSTILSARRVRIVVVSAEFVEKQVGGPEPAERLLDRLSE